tara:strand:- start:3457 stop:4599 length:1143 start_codon:yes stop_codon:yes gene_type:complete
MAKETQENLPAVIETAIAEQKIDTSKATVILPTQSFGALISEYEKVTMEVVKISANPADGEVFEPGGKGKGKALTKVPLLRIGNAIGLVWVPRETTILESSERKSRAKATALFRKANGEWITITEEKTVDIDAIEEKQRISAEDDAEKGPLLLDQYGKIVWHQNPTYPERDPAGWQSEADKQKHIDREVRKSLIQYRLYKDERAMTGAKERVIRAILAIKNTYTDAELSRPFAFPRIVADPAAMMKQPELREAAISMMAGKIAQVFGEKTEDEKADLQENIQTTGEEKILTASVIEGDPVSEIEAVVDPFDVPPKPEEPIEDPRIAAIVQLEEYAQSNIMQRNPEALKMIRAVIDNKNATIEEIDTMIDRCHTYEGKHGK